MLGIADLLVAVSLGTTARLFGGPDLSMVPIRVLPLSLIPTFLVPLSWGFSRNLHRPGKGLES
jgi:hypothetical protein